MKKRLFTDSDIEPTDYLLEKHLGKAMHFYKRILGASGNCRRQWQFNRGNGWILRVHNAYKPLYYLIAFDEGIEVSLTIRDSEREDFLKSAGLELSYPELRSGTRYSGGYALRFEIENEVDCSSASQFLAHLMKTRIPITKSFSLKKIKKDTGSNRGHNVTLLLEQEKRACFAGELQSVIEAKRQFRKTRHITNRCS